MLGSVSAGFLATEVEDSDELSPPVSEKKREAGYAGWFAGPLPRARAADSGDTARLLFYFFYSNLNLVFTNDF